jgi:hypothetical protein
MESYNKGSGIPALSDVDSATMRTLLGTQCLGTAGLVIGSSAATAVKIANTVPYKIANVLYSKTTAEIAHTDLTVQAADTTKYYLLSLNAAGTGVITQGTATTLPAVPADNCPIGYIKVVTVAVTFTPGTDSHAAAGVTTTYTNISQLPLTLA